MTTAAAGSHGRQQKGSHDGQAATPAATTGRQAATAGRQPRQAGRQPRQAGRQAATAGRQPRQAATSSVRKCVIFIFVCGIK